MISGALDSFSEHLFRLLISDCKPLKGMLVKKHSENLKSHGEFSFPNNVKSWHEYIDMSTSVESSEVSLMSYINKHTEDLRLASKDWIITISKVREENDRVYIYLERPKTIKVGLLEGMKNNALLTQTQSHENNLVCIDPLCENDNTLTSLRLRCFQKCVENLYNLNETCKEMLPRLIITSKSSSKNVESKVILCGAVLNSKTGFKETVIGAEDFIRLRQDEMTLIAQHKYGVRVTTDSKWKEFISHLGESAAVFELLQTKPSSAVKINFDSSSTGASKGSAFILYNCARLETILRTFHDKVNEGLYPPLPNYEDTDFNLLTQEDEWCLIFNYVMGLPALIKNCVEINERICEIRPHLICGFLSSLVKIVSQYYRKVRILTEPRKHLLPVMFARIHMLKILNENLKALLNILNIKSVSQM